MSLLLPTCGPHPLKCPGTRPQYRELPRPLAIGMHLIAVISYIKVVKTEALLKWPPPQLAERYPPPAIWEGGPLARIEEAGSWPILTISSSSLVPDQPLLVRAYPPPGVNAPRCRLNTDKRDKTGGGEFLQYESPGCVENLSIQEEWISRRQQ